MRFLTLVALLASTVSLVAADTERKYETVKGFFLQDDDATDPKTFDPKANNFGLKPIANKTAGQTDWEAFADQVKALNAAADPSTSYKLIFMARHGEGWHNVARAYYGDVAWATYWCHKDGNGTVTWFDAHLTPNGEAQTRDLSSAWQHQLDAAKTPAPQAYYVSPLDRTCATANITFSTLTLPAGAAPFVPTVKEKLREVLGVTTENERSNKTYIAGQFPDYTFEAGFTEDDELWKPYWFELPPQQDKRMTELMDDIFATDKNSFISYTSHSFSVASLLRVVGHRAFDLDTAGMLPVLVKSTVTES